MTEALIVQGGGRDHTPAEDRAKLEQATAALATLRQVTGSNNKDNPWLGVAAAVALLQMQIKDKTAEVERLTRERDEALAENRCDVCDARPLESGRECMCGGTGKKSAAVQYLRERVVAVEADAVEGRRLLRAKAAGDCARCCHYGWIALPDGERIACIHPTCEALREWLERGGAR